MTEDNNQDRTQSEGQDKIDLSAIDIQPANARRRCLDTPEVNVFISGNRRRPDAERTVANTAQMR